MKNENNDFIFTRPIAIDDSIESKDNPIRPSHYRDGKIEPIDFIEDKDLGFHLGNAIKYISRAGKKNDEIQDLKKAIWYIQRYIESKKEPTEEEQLKPK